MALHAADLPRIRAHAARPHIRSQQRALARAARGRGAGAARSLSGGFRSAVRAGRARRVARHKTHGGGTGAVAGRARLELGGEVPCGNNSVTEWIQNKLYVSFSLYA